MFGKMMNSFYYGKSGKGDFRKEDLPKNRWQLFWEMLRVRLSGLCRMNLMTIVIFIPLIYVIGSSLSTFLSGVSLSGELTSIVQQAGVTQTEDMTAEEYNALVTQALLAADRTQEEADFLLSFSTTDFIQSVLFHLVVWCIPCIAITGPVQAGMAYVTRNWARDEHAFVWSDFKDAFKANWKQGLLVSCITSVLPAIVYICWNFYGQMASSNGVFFVIPQVLVAMLAFIWVLGLTYMYPMMVSYKVKAGMLIKNSLMMGIARLPQTLGIRLIMLLPALIAGLLLFFTSIGVYALLVLALYYIVLGNALSRFVYASLSNAVFDRFINSHMEGVQINRGLSDEDDEDEDETDDTEHPTDGNPPAAQ